MVSNSKFDSEDRRRVIREIENRFAMTLEGVGGRPKWRRDRLSRNWCILGGIGLWHGIPKEMVDAERRSNRSGILIIAKKGNELDVFEGSFRELAEQADRLFENQQDHYHFDCNIRGERMFVNGRDSFRVTTLKKTFSL